MGTRQTSLASLISTFRPRKRRMRKHELESLESRRLLSQISVGSFGAVPNDGRDDKGAIQSAINASAPGDTIVFPGGTYNLSDQVFLKGNGRIYQGNGSAILIDTDPTRHIFHIQEDNTTVDGFTFNGRPIMIDRVDSSGRPVAVNNITIRNNTLNINSTDDPSGNGITFSTGLNNSSITYNTFNLNSSFGIYGYYWNNLLIGNNDFLNGTQGIHVDNLDGNGWNMTIEQNYFSGIRRMGIEYQSGGHNTIVQDNYFEKPNLSTNSADNVDAIAFSVVADRSFGTITRRNVINAPEHPDGTGIRIGFETGGDGSVLETNWVYGTMQAAANTDGNGTTSLTAHDNYFAGVKEGIVGRGVTQYNNGSSINNQWLIDRGPAGRDRRFANPSSPSGDVQTSQSTQASPSPDASGSVYLSDLNWTSMTNGWGPAEKNRSNGDLPAGDGKTLTLNGQTYAKGIGAHAPSEIVYNLGGQYSQFFSDVGIDDEVGNNGSAVFQVWLDGVKAYDSGTMSGSSATKSVNLNVSGKTTMKLVITVGPDNNASDHGDWAGARLTTGSATWLSDLNWSSMTNGWGPAEKNRSNGDLPAGDGRTLTLNGQTYAKGIGAHASSEIVYALGGQYSQFSSDIGVDDEVGNNGSVVFQVWLDGVKAYDSGIMTGSSATKSVNLDVSGKTTMKLVITTGGDNNASDHGDWAGAKLIA